MIATDGGIFGKKAFIFCGFSDDDVGALSEFVTQAGGKRCRNADGCVLLLIAFLYGAVFCSRADSSFSCCIRF